MESLCKAIGENRRLKEDQIIEKLSNALDSGGDIDFFFPQDDSKINSGTILHYAIRKNYQSLVEYALSRGASIQIKRTSRIIYNDNCTALDLATMEYQRRFEYFMDCEDPIYKIVSKQSLELCCSHGLTPLHLECALKSNLWTDEALQNLQSNINATISTDSPIWPGMTPVLIAAKFVNTELVKKMLDLGADPLVRDPENNTPLHYLGAYYFFDERLFAFDGSNTFSSQTGESHFHLACGYFEEDTPRALDIVKRYLDQGISPDLPIRKNVCENHIDAGRVGLHIAVDVLGPKLLELLLEYGADVHLEDCSVGRTPIEVLSVASYVDLDGLYIDCLCLLIEAGSNTKRIDLINDWINFISEIPVYWRLKFLSCIVKLTTLNKNLVSPNLKDLFLEILKKFDDWNEAEYAGKCSEELKALSSFNLRQVLDNTAVVSGDFKSEFGWLDSFHFESYPIYGSLLKMRIKRGLVEYENKKTIIRDAVPQLQSMLQSLCRLPHLCVELILWNLNRKELDQFMAQLQ